MPDVELYRNLLGLEALTPSRSRRGGGTSAVTRKTFPARPFGSTFRQGDQSPSLER
jgi:hypothetical protein